MSKESSLNELTEKIESVEFGGGKEKIEQQHKMNKLTARERIANMLDTASFVELDKFVERSVSTPGFESVTSAGEGVITGFGTINEKPVYIFIQDYTVLNGSMSVTHAKKIFKIMNMALQNGAPLIGILDSGGARVAEGAAVMDAYASIINKLNELSGVVPTISIVAGPCIGAAAYIASLCDFTIAVDKISTVLLHGSQIVSSTIGENPAQVSGAMSQNEKTGIAQFFAPDEYAAFGIVKKILSYIPGNNLDEAPYEIPTDDINRQISELDTGDEHDINNLILRIADNSEFFEYQTYYAANVRTGFARMNGYTVGIIANYPGTSLDGKAAKKAARFISLLNAYNIPIITLADCEDIPVEAEIEHPCLINAIAKLLFSYAQASVPKITVITGKAIATGLLAMGAKSNGADIVYAWSNAEISALPSEAGALILYDNDIAKSDNPVLAKSNAIEKYKTEYASAFSAAKQGIVDDVIAPSATRQMIIAAMEACMMKRENKMPKKHGVLPL